jgi:hypothetical protein
MCVREQATGVKAEERRSLKHMGLVLNALYAPRGLPNGSIYRGD